MASSMPILMQQREFYNSGNILIVTILTPHLLTLAALWNADKKWLIIKVEMHAREFFDFFDLVSCLDDVIDCVIAPT
jgi:hypothetical protein